MVDLVLEYHKRLLDQRNASDKPQTFPHVCPHVVGGATREQCRALTEQVQKNLAGCCRGMERFDPCNSEERACLSCIEEGKMGREARRVVDFDRGLCLLHFVRADPEEARAIERQKKLRRREQLRAILREVAGSREWGDELPQDVTRPKQVVARIDESVPRIDLPEPMLDPLQWDEIITRFHSKVELPTLREMFDVIVGMELAGVRGGGIGEQFGRGPRWVSEYMKLKQLSDDAWRWLIVNAPHFSQTTAYYIVLRQDVAEHLAAIQQAVATGGGKRKTKL